MKFDAAVLGAGIVGISVALHLQARGRTVALLDRRGAVCSSPTTSSLRPVRPGVNAERSMRGL